MSAIKGLQFGRELQAKFDNGANLLNVVTPISAVLVVPPEYRCPIRCSDLIGKSRRNQYD